MYIDSHDPMFFCMPRGAAAPPASAMERDWAHPGGVQQPLVADPSPIELLLLVAPWPPRRVPAPAWGLYRLLEVAHLKHDRPRRLFDVLQELAAPPSCDDDDDDAGGIARAYWWSSDCVAFRKLPFERVGRVASGAVNGAG